MSIDYVIGCDVGTSGTKAVITDKGGKVIAHAYKPYGILTPKAQWAEQWPDIWLDAVVDTITEVSSKIDPHSIKGICISALYGGTGVLCDGNMTPIRPSIIWMDRRAEKESQWVSDNIGKDEILKVTGNGIDSYFGYTKMLWVKNNEPENWNKIKRIIPIHSYIVYKLTGELVVDNCSAGNIGGIYDYNTNTWSSDMMDRLGIDIDTMPMEFRNPTDIAGVLNEEFSSRMGIPPDIPICVGTVDCVASMLSAAMVNKGDGAAVLGTSLNWGFIHDEVPSNPDLISMPYCTDPQKMSYTYGGASTAGALPRWFVTNFLNGESAETYKGIEDEIISLEIPPGANGLLMLPYFMGERTPIWDENASGLVMGLSLMHQKAHLYKAVLESTAYSLRHIMQTMDSNIVTDRIILMGGGAKSYLWQTIFADVTGLPVYTAKTSIEAPMGDAFMAALAVGLVDSYSQIKDWVEFKPPVMPNKGNHTLYNRYFSVYKEIYPLLKGKMKELKEISKM